MTPDEYQRAAMRTENTPNFIRRHRLSEDFTLDAKPSPREAADQRLSRMIHAILGMITELGELCDPLKRHLVYGAELEAVERMNMIEEVGDGQWYSALMTDALGQRLEEILERNIAKLRARYPSKFTEDNAINRDLNAEQKALEGKPLPSLAGLRYGGEAASRMMEEIVCLKPYASQTDAQTIFAWRRVFDFVGGEQVLNDNDPKHVLSAMADVAHRLGIDRPTKIIDGLNERLSTLCCEEIEALKQQNFELIKRLTKIQTGLQALSNEA